MRSLIVALLVILTSGPALAYEEPAHTVELEDGRFEVRTYEPMIIASVIVNAEGRRASSLGFRPLADYIFGNNTAKAEIEMTAPVTQREVSQKIDMTVPVLQAGSSPGQTMVAFVMPSEWTMASLPTPNNSDVEISEVPSRRVVSYRFYGSGTDKQQTIATEILGGWMDMNDLVPIGEPIFNFYSGPWIPGPLRKNEVHFEIARPES
ncbi:MAG: heme-binding protein [Pseudomonadota bacterium]